MAFRTALRPTLSSVCSTCRHRLHLQQTRLASTTSNSSSDWAAIWDAPAPTPTSGNAPTPEEESSSPAPPSQRPSRSRQSAQSIFKSFPQTTSPSNPAPQTSSQDTSTSSSNFTASLLSSLSTDPSLLRSSLPHPSEPYHINILAHKHNTHITFTAPSRDPILSISTGQLGFKKAQRKTFDASYQLAAYTMRKISTAQWRIGGKNAKASAAGAGAGTGALKTIRDIGTKDTGVGIELIMRGYGPGREAFTKALLGNEGGMLKPMIVRVTDATRLKFGGTRSPQVRRLG